MKTKKIEKIFYGVFFTLFVLFIAFQTLRVMGLIQVTPYLS